ncbi:ankyrin repeat-containing domain protein [Ilyonectria destructans]|nr:ankyrin repeat-containing domain protein [Ilyonectria destructans]
MDPLSITASIVALLQATTAVGKGIKFLHSLSHIPDEFCDLVNELATLQAVLGQVTSALKELQGDNPAAPVLRVDLTKALVLENELRQTVETARATRRDGKLAISKKRWLRERSSIAHLKAKACAAKSDLSLCFESLISTQRFARQTRVSIDIHRLVAMTYDGLTSEVERSAKIAETHQSSFDKVHESLNRLHAKALDLEQLIRTTVKPMPTHNGGAASHMDEIYTSGTVWSFQASLRLPCSAYCNCQCHRQSQVETPKWIRSAFGSLFLRYNSLPVWDTRPCRVEKCKRSHGSIRLRYTFPQWMIAREVSLATSGHSIVGYGAALHAKIRRVLPDGLALAAIAFNDLEWLKRALVSNKLHVTDLDQSGKSLMNLALYHRNLKVTRFLFEHGSPPGGEDNYGWSVAKEARLKLYSPKAIYRDPGDNDLLRRLSELGDEDEVRISTLIHDCLLGINPISLSTAIAQVPSDINRLDDFDLAPIHWCIRKHDFVSFKMLLAHPPVDIHITHPFGTFLHWAARNEYPGSSDMARSLLDAGLDANSQNGHNRTPIYFSFHNPETVQLLLEHGATTVNFSQHESEMENPVSWFVERWNNIRRSDPQRQNWERSLKLLLGFGVDLDTSQWEGRTLIHRAILYQNNALLELLIQYGARTDAVDNDGNGILHFAAQAGDLELIEVLSDAKIQGIKTNALNEAGETPSRIMAVRMTGQLKDEWGPGVNVATYEEFLLFRLLLEEIDERNRSGQYAVDGVDVSPDARIDALDIDEETGQDGAASEGSFRSEVAFANSDASTMDLLSESDDDQYRDSNRSENDGSEDEFMDARDSWG